MQGWKWKKFMTDVENVLKMIFNVENVFGRSFLKVLRNNGNTWCNRAENDFAC